MTLGVSANQGTDALDIWVPSTAGTTLGVRYVISEAGAFAADVAY